MIIWRTLISRKSGFLLAALCLFLVAPLRDSLADDSLCVQVKIEIDQKLALERQGFQASMGINNGGAEDITNFNVVVNFTDANGNAVTASSDPNNTSAQFFIQLTSPSAIPGTIAAGTSTNLQWQIIPAQSTGGTNPAGLLYYVGATVTYTAGGVNSTIPVQPAGITVLPMPQLTLDYFLPSNVYGDDPFTPQIEPPIPFSLGVRVKNTGAGVANDVEIASSQPQIVANEQGLLVNYQIVGSEVNGLPSTPSLLVDFGNIQPNSSGVARWTMTCSVSGSFVSFSATFTHSDDLGGKLTALISSVNTHILIHDILVDLPGRDNIRDFLASDPGAIRVYESQNYDSTVADLSASSTIAGSGYNYAITTPPVTGFSYAKLTDPLAGSKVISSVTRSDGKPINVNNAWLSKEQDNVTQLWSYYISIFDTNNPMGASYNVVYADPVGNDIPVVRQPPDQVVEVNTFDGFIFQASDPQNKPLTLSASSLPAGATFADGGNGTGSFTWTPGSSQTGSYPVQFTASNGQYSTSVTVTITVTNGTPLKDWKNRYWPGVTNPNIIGNCANPSGDGLTNLVKYALGLDPTIPDEDGAPTITTVQFGGQNYLALDYVARTNDLNLSLFVVAADSVLTSDSNWVTVTGTMPADQSGVPTNFQHFIIRDSAPIDGTLQKRFLRLGVSTTESN